MRNINLFLLIIFFGIFNGMLGVATQINGLRGTFAVLLSSSGYIFTLILIIRIIAKKEIR